MTPDWSIVMSRPDWTEAEKAARWAEQCRQRGIKADPKSYNLTDHIHKGANNG